MTDRCELTESELAESLVGAERMASREHIEHCAHCTRFVEQAAQLRESLGRIKEASDDEMRGIDLSARLLETIEVQEQRSWHIPFALAGAVLAGLLLLIWQWPETGHRIQVQVDAPRGALRTTQRGIEGIKGEGLHLPLPLRLSTQANQSAQLHIASATIDFAGDAEIELDKDGSLRIRRGLVDVRSPREKPFSPIQIIADKGPSLSLRGHASIETQSGTTPMKLLKRHKIIAASAVAIVVLYSGYATVIKKDQPKERVAAPAGLYVDEDGKSHRFDPILGHAETALAAASGSGDEDVDDETGSFLPKGAYWSESEQVVQFRIRGEAFDGDTGHPLDGFELTAALLTSGDFGQREAVNKSFSNLEEGRFTLKGLGVGTWQITASREGYAPVIQTLEIADLRATPYLVIPLSPSGAKLSGRVLDWRGRPVPDAKIGLANCLQGNAKKLKAGCNLVSSDTQGRFVIDKLPEEEVYALYAKHERYGFATSNNHRSQPEGNEAGQHITIRLSGVVRIYGTVAKGKGKAPVANAVVQGAGGQTQTSASGDYELLVPLEEQPAAYVSSYPGSATQLEIHSYPEDRSVRPLEWVDAEDHAAQVRIDFLLEMSPATLSGVVRSSDGKPLENVELQLMNTNGWKKDRKHETYPTKAITDAGGNYRVDNIPNEAGYQIIYRIGDDEDWQDLGYVNIPEEGDLRADFQIGTSTVRGRFVSSETGAPVSVAQSSCSRLGAERDNTSGVFTLAHCYPDGRFEIVGLLPGSYVLHSKTEWMSSSVKLKPESVTLVEGQVLTDVKIEVEGEGAILWRFRILNTENEFLAGAYIRYQVGSSNTTANLQLREDGSSQQQLSESVKEIFLEVSGYTPKKLILKEHDPDKIIDIHLKKLPNNED